MNLNQLKERKTQIEETFEKYAAEQKQLTEQSAQIEQEKLRLQGEYRTVQGFIDEMEAQPKAKKQVAKGLTGNA